MPACCLLMVWLLVEVWSAYFQTNAANCRTLHSRCGRVSKTFLLSHTSFIFFEIKEAVREATGPRWSCKKKVWQPTLHFIVFLSQAHITSPERTHTRALSVTDLLFSGFTLWRFNLLIRAVFAFPCIQIALFLSRDTRFLQHQRPWWTSCLKRQNLSMTYQKWVLLYWSKECTSWFFIILSRRPLWVTKHWYLIHRADGVDNAARYAWKSRTIVYVCLCVLRNTTAVFTCTPIDPQMVLEWHVYLTRILEICDHIVAE